ncbi:AAA family ATPase [Leptolyngbya sp. FACHB-17]|uniref:AAA family ATPase n=1 Tax=unclassified Leptolyngbya TaxID=2650499 RepID=UPI00167FE602|nr:ATP-dependent Clp protease ATP-binding subunit [Leptolyngbya sp. FACHB-17]
MFDKFTERTIKVVNAAQGEARRLEHNYVGTEQLLLGLIATRPSIAAQVLADLDVTLEEAQEQVQAVIGRGTGLSRAEIPFTPRSRRVLEQSLQEAERLGYGRVEPEHLLLAIVQDDAGLATQILERLGVERTEVRINVLQAISEAKPILKGNSSGRKTTPILNECGANLTELAALGKLDPVIGRTQEVERMIQILGRRTKNNPILIGEPGVGKTALAEGLAQRIVDRDVPESLQDQQVLTLNIGTLLAGTKYRGEFEERLKTIMKEVRSSGNIILVIDEVHTLLGSGSTQGSLDAANILKPALARGDLRCIGATTLDEYRQYFEQDAALERRFQPVMIDEPSVEETILILQGLRSRYEQHHRLEISDLALEAAAKLADRYIPDRLLPDKAIDLIDEAGSRARILHGKQFTLDKSLSARLKQIFLTKANAIAQQDFRRAGEVRSSELTLQAEVQTETPAFGSSIVVNEVDIAEIVSAWTGVPVNKVTEAESEQLMQMEAVLHQRLIGQEEAVNAIARATRRARVGLSNPNRPIASFIFSGPTGVGKTELVKALAACFFGSESAMIRLDMSEFMERHTVSKLIGSPPGYVGYSEGGQLTEAVRRKPYTVVLFDEIEKAHPDVFNLLLQILEDGRLTDAKGRVVNFKNTLLVMTSNVGSKVIQKGGSGLGFELSTNVLEASYQRTVTLVNEELKQYFRPEFLNRLDDIIVFRQLTHDEIKQIANLLLNEFSDRLLEQGIKLEVSDRVKNRLVEAGYHPEQGARPLRRAITRLLEDSLAEAILSGRVKPGDSAKVDLDEQGQLKIV